MLHGVNDDVDVGRPEKPSPLGDGVVTKRSSVTASGAGNKLIRRRDVDVSKCVDEYGMRLFNAR